MTTKRCIKCKLVKSTSQFYKQHTNNSGLSSRCKGCLQIYNAGRTERGLQIMQALAMSKSCCEYCQRPYSNEDWHFFEFDHINPNQKRSNVETHSLWVNANQDEFNERVAPNLQLLCVKCHKIKTSEESKLGGSVHQKKYGESKPAEVLDFGWSLFNPIPLPETDDYTSWSWSLIQREGNWIVQRDIDGRIINSELSK